MKIISTSLYFSSHGKAILPCFGLNCSPSTEYSLSLLRQDWFPLICFHCALLIYNGACSFLGRTWNWRGNTLRTIFLSPGGGFHIYLPLTTYLRDNNFQFGAWFIEPCFMRQLAFGVFHHYIIGFWTFFYWITYRNNSILMLVFIWNLFFCQGHIRQQNIMTLCVSCGLSQCVHLEDYAQHPWFVVVCGCWVQVHFAHIHQCPFSV